MALSKISGTTGIADATITSAKLADFTAAVDLNGVELLLDADADTSISADTDDQIDIKIANADHLKILSSSGDTVLKPMVDAKDIIFQQFDGNKVFEINDGNFVGVGGNATAAGQIRIYEDTDNGSHYSGFTVGNLTASVAYQLPDADGSSGQALITDGSGVLSFSTIATNTPTSADGQALGSVSLEWSDLFLADASTIQFGADQDVILTHVADTGLLLSGTNVIQFNDASQNIGAPSNRILDINATDEIELNATLVDVNANLDVSGTITSGGVITGTAFTAGSAVLAEAELELLDGLTAGTAIASKVVTTDANIDSTGMRNLTISGEIDAATGDFSGAVDVAGATTTAAITASGLITANANITMAGTTPTLTIGDAGAEDTKIIFDGNAQDFHIGLDDSADDLVIGKGSALGTTPAITVNEDLETNIANIQNPVDPFRNIIINGNMEVAQRTASTSGITSDGFYSVDRFNLGIGSFGTWTQSQETDTPAGYGFTRSLKMDCTTAQGSPGSSALITFDYAIEGQMLQRGNIGTANAKKLCLTFFHKHTKTGINTVELLDADNADAVSGSYTQSVSNTWEKATIIFPAKTSGTFDNDNNRSLRVRICLGAGTDSTSGTLATTWQSSITNANRHAGQVNNADSTSNNFIITGVQLEFGDRPTDFEHVPFDVNLLRCQRYLSKMKQNGSGNNIRFCSGVCTSGTASELAFIVYPQLRATPSLTVSGTPAHYRIRSENARDASGISNDNRHINGVNIQGAVSSGQTAGFSANLDAQNAAAEVTLDAEM